MERLWAPWRMEYIEKASCSACFICAAFQAPKEQDARNLVVYRNETAMVIMNRYPYNNGHLMIAPILHGVIFEELPAASLAEIDRLSQMVVRLMNQLFNPHGFNLGYNIGRTAGAGLVDHLHLHIVPRWNGDTNFMPVLGDTRVISEALDKTYSKLKQAFDVMVTH